MFLSINFVRTFKSLFLFFILLTLSACSAITGSEISPNETNRTSNQTSNPIKLSLVQGYIAGTTLHLRVQVEILDNIETKSIVIQLKGLKNGLLNETQSQPLATIVKKAVVSKGNIFILPLTLSTEDIDRFAISCSWGEDGIKIMNQLRNDLTDDDNIQIHNKQPKVEEGAVVITDIKISEKSEYCALSNCPLRLDLEGKVKPGKGYKQVKNVNLAYRLLWLPDGQLPNLENNSNELLPDEKLLSFGNHSIPEEGFDFQVTGEKELPQIPGGRFIPVVRVLKFDATK